MVAGRHRPYVGAGGVDLAFGLLRQRRDPPPQSSPADTYEMAQAMAAHTGTEAPAPAHDAPAPAHDPVLLPVDTLHHDTAHDHFVA